MNSEFSVLLGFEINNTNVYSALGKFDTIYNGSEIRKLAFDSLKTSNYASHCITRISHLNRTFNKSVDLRDETVFDTNETIVIQIEVILDFINCEIFKFLILI
jgi:hypothetical protein